MKSSTDVLSSVLKTTQMGQVGIRSVLNIPLQADLREALKSQLKEYDSIERDAQAIASSRGWTLEDLHPVAKRMAMMTARTKLSYGNSSSKTAAMMIQGNTRGMIKGYKNLNAYNHADQQVCNISQKLLDCEKANILQMQGFL